MLGPETLTAFRRLGLRTLEVATSTYFGRLLCCPIEQPVSGTLRIIHIFWDPTSGGIDRLIHGLCRRIGSNDLQVQLYTTSRKGFEVRTLAHKITAFQVCQLHSSKYLKMN